MRGLLRSASFVRFFTASFSSDQKLARSPFTSLSQKWPMVMPSQARSEMRNQKRVLTFPLSGASKKAPFYKKRGASTSLNSTRGVASKSVCLKPIFFPIFAELLTTFAFR